MRVIHLIFIKTLKSLLNFLPRGNKVRIFCFIHRKYIFLIVSFVSIILTFKNLDAKVNTECVICSKTYPSFLTVKEGFFLPLRLSCKESSTFLTKPLFPQEREDVTALRCSEPLRYKVGGPKRSSPGCAGWDRLIIRAFA